MVQVPTALFVLVLRLSDYDLMDFGTIENEWYAIVIHIFYILGILLRSLMIAFFSPFHFNRIENKRQFEERVVECRRLV